MVFAGGAEELSWECATDSMQWVRFQPSTMIPQKKASRAYDANRDGFVIAGGGAVVVVRRIRTRISTWRKNLRRNRGLRCNL